MSHSRWRPLTAFFDACLKVITGILVLLLLGTVTAGIVFRAANHPLGWSDEVSGFLMVWLACLGWMIATRHGTHIRISLVQDMLPLAAWRTTEVLIQIAVAVIGGVVAWNSIHLMRVNSDIEAMSLPVSVAWMYAPLLPAGLVTMLQGLADMYKARRAEAATGGL